jgi:hypothetical protein
MWKAPASVSLWLPGCAAADRLRRERRHLGASNGGGAGRDRRTHVLLRSGYARLRRRPGGAGCGSRVWPGDDNLARSDPWHWGAA